MAWTLVLLRIGRVKKPAVVAGVEGIEENTSIAGELLDLVGVDDFNFKGRVFACPRLRLVLEAISLDPDGVASGREGVFTFVFKSSVIGNEENVIATLVPDDARRGGNVCNPT
jgi:hypothetical protein